MQQLSAFATRWNKGLHTELRRNIALISDTTAIMPKALMPRPTRFPMPPQKPPAPIRKVRRQPLQTTPTPTPRFLLCCQAVWLFRPFPNAT